jgi:cysteine-rich repeat protein
MKKLALLVLCAGVIAGCPSDPGPADTGGTDTGGVDTGGVDGGGVDGGGVDGGGVDGGGTDAGPPTCGDRAITPPETCDDGNTMAGDGCDGSCQIEASSSCGNGMVERAMGEECDDGNTTAGDGCSATCRVEVTASCGNGMLEPGMGEECDDGNTTNGDGCNATCQLETVGAFCGDSMMDPGERCDDGNLTNGDACNPTCNFTNTTTLFAGSPGMAGSTDGVGTAARLGAIGATGMCGANGGMAADNTYVYYGDTNNHVLRRIEVATATVTTIAGTGAMGLTDNATGLMATFQSFEAVTTDGATVWVADSCRIRAISLAPPHAVTTVAGGACVPMAMAATIADGVGTAATWSDLRGLTYYRGRVYSVDANAAVLRSFDPVSGMVTTLAGVAGMTGSMDGVGAAARFVSPRYMASDNSGMLYVADTNGAEIRAFNAVTNEVTSFAGDGTSGIVDGVGTAARIGRPRGMTSDGTSIYWVEFNAHLIRQGVLATQSVTTMIGTAMMAGYTEGVGSAARIASPFGITYHYPSRSLFWLDGGNCVIRRVQ